jgi:hypothetical protein
MHYRPYCNKKCTLEEKKPRGWLFDFALRDAVFQENVEGTQCLIFESSPLSEEKILSH